MPFTAKTVRLHPRVGKPMALSTGHADPATVALTLHYFEFVSVDQVWRHQERTLALVRETHYRLDKRRGIVMLLDHRDFPGLGLWRSADTREPLLVDGKVRHPQYIEATFEAYMPEEAEAGTFDPKEKDPEAKARLGYDMPRYCESREEPEPALFNWEDSAEPR